MRLFLFEQEFDFGICFFFNDDFLLAKKFSRNKRGECDLVGSWKGFEARCFSI